MIQFCKILQPPSVQEFYIKQVCKDHFDRHSYIDNFQILNLQKISLYWDSLVSSEHFGEKWQPSLQSTLY